MLYNIIDSAENKIEDIFNFLKPIIKGTAKIALEEKLKYYFTFKSAFFEEKLNIFIDSLKDFNSIDEKFLNKMNDDEKVFFSQTINKILELDDSLQIYILAYLTQQYFDNQELNYYEKQLYYNISSFSTDDFEIFYSMYKKNTLKDEYKSFSLSTMHENKEILDISLRKFSNIGLLRNEKELIYKASAYSLPLFELLEKYSQDLMNEKIIFRKASTLTKISYYK